MLTKLVCWYRGKTKEELALEFTFNYWITRSRAKAYWYTITGKHV